MAMTLRLPEALAERGRRHAAQLGISLNGLLAIAVQHLVTLVFLSKPTEPPLRYTYWLHYAEGSLMPPLLMKLVFNRVTSAPMPFFVRPIARRIAEGAMTSYIGPEIDLHLDDLEGELERNTWFVGAKFTAADVQLSFPLEAVAAAGGLGASRPKLAAFVDRIHARPAYKRALERGGPYELLR